MRSSLFSILLLFIFSCDSGSFDKDKRQIMAKDVLRAGLPPRAKNFDVLSFKEDTLSAWKDSAFRHPIRYTITYRYTDAAGAVQEKKGKDKKLWLRNRDGNSKRTSRYPFLTVILLFIFVSFPFARHMKSFSHHTTYHLPSLSFA